MKVIVVVLAVLATVAPREVRECLERTFRVSRRPLGGVA
jgi:hypothetical protein